MCKRMPVTITKPDPIDGADERKGSFPRAATRERAIPLLIAALVVVLDHFSKLFVEIFLPLNRTWAPIPQFEQLFRITHVSNTGAAFGLFPGGSMLFTLIAIVVTAVIVFYNYGLPGGNRLLRLALGLQVGGALGNLIDRLRLGHVTDFMDVGPWPIFNLADTSIVAGVIILCLLLWLEQRQPSKRAPSEESAAAQGSLSNLSSQRQNEQAT